MIDIDFEATTDPLPKMSQNDVANPPNRSIFISRANKNIA
ncbi:hypothetical protein RLEG12_25135 [Rhizobium leguminosarum bv. trifolii CB782]|nr:hypothetical protein RLEG12_25135 [Rhizobium leguminosarum bv. trifolii CB782]